MNEEEFYQRHLENEHWGDPDYHDDPAHPDGCYWCGSMWHPSTDCKEKMEFGYE